MSLEQWWQCNIGYNPPPPPHDPSHPSPGFLIVVPVSNSLWRQLVSKHKSNDQTILSTSLEEFKNSGDSVILGIVPTPLQTPLLSCFRSVDLWGQLVSKRKPNNQSILSTSSEQFKNNDGSVTVSTVPILHPIPHPTPEILILVPVSNSLWRQLVSNKSNDQTVPSTSLAHVINSSGSVTMGTVPPPFPAPPPPQPTAGILILVRDIKSPETIGVRQVQRSTCSKHEVACYAMPFIIYCADQKQTNKQLNAPNLSNMVVLLLQFHMFNSRTRLITTRTCVSAWSYSHACSSQQILSQAHDDEDISMLIRMKMGHNCMSLTVDIVTRETNAHDTDSHTTLKKNISVFFF